MNRGALDREFLVELLEGDREFGQELLAAFVEASTQWLKEGRSACLGSDPTLAARAFHTLKGSAGSVGLASVRALALQLEDAAKQGRLDLCADRLAELEAEITRGQTELAEFLESL
jgi:HPt (histidine-containing phosphotransfer) domain-containing protein